MALDFDADDPYEITETEAKQNKKKAEGRADELLAEHMLYEFLPGDLSLPTDQRILSAWLTTLKSFKQFYEVQVSKLPEGAEILFARKIKSKWATESLGAKEDAKDLTEFARMVVQHLFEGKGSSQDPAATLKQVWSVQAASLPTEPAKRQTEPASWQPKMMERRSEVYRNLLDLEAQGDLIINVVYKLADRRCTAKLKRYRSDKFELEYQQLTEEMRDDEVRRARITRLLEDQARADKKRRDAEEAREARRNSE